RVSENVPGSEAGHGKGPGRRYGAMDAVDLLALSSRSRTVSNIAAFGLVRPTTTIGGDATRMDGFSVTAGFFPLIGVSPLIGRTFTADESLAGHDHVVVLGYDAWQRFGGAPTIVGGTLTFSGDPTSPFGGTLALGVPYMIVGVMPSGFRFPYDNAQFWVPRVVTPTANGRPLRLQTIARLSEGVTTVAAAAEMEEIRRDLHGASTVPP